MGRMSVPGKGVQVETGLEGELGFFLGRGAGRGWVSNVPGKNSIRMVWRDEGTQDIRYIVMAELTWGSEWRVAGDGSTKCSIWK